MSKPDAEGAAPSAPATTVRQFTVGRDDEGIRLDRWFKRHLPQIGFATISRWARTGQIRVDGKRAAPEDRLAAGQIVRVPPGDSHAPGMTGRSGPARKPLTEAQIEMAHAMLLHRDPAAIVLNKVPGLATQGGSGMHEHVDGLLDAFISEGPKAGPRPRLVHRLDKDTSGALLVAATPGSAAFFAKRFATRAAQKVYWALVVGMPSPDEGLIDLPLAKQPGTGGEKMMVDKSEQGMPSRSKYRVIDRAGNSCAWVELQPLTGRTHQLRVHMAAIGHPIVGDGKYGGPAAFLTGSISRKLHLHARRIVIGHPDGTLLDVTAPLPDHFAASLASLGFDEADGDAFADDLTAPAPLPDREDFRMAARAHAKQVRKERRGERRKRGDGPGADAPTKGKGSKAPTRKAGVGKAETGKPGAGIRVGKPGAGKPAFGKAPTGKPSDGKPAFGKTPASKPARARPAGPQTTARKPGPGSRSAAPTTGRKPPR